MSPLKQGIFLALILMVTCSVASCSDLFNWNMDGGDGNVIALVDGSNHIWDRDLSETDFVATVYAWDAQRNNYMTWTQGEGNYRPLQLSDTSIWVDGSVTWKFVAPAGKVFDGGIVTIRAASIWGATTAELAAHAVYSNNDWGVGGYVSGTLYDMDNHAMPESWTWSDYAVDVPVDQNEFYVSFAAREDWHSVWGSTMEVNGVVTKNTPPPVKIQPALDNVTGNFGNSVVLSDGTQTIWNNTLTEAQMVGKIYATDAQQTNVMTWTQGETDARPLALTNTGTWADASATWKFVAPAGKVFDGGTITLQAASIWGTTTGVSLSAGNAYSNSGWGTGGANSTYGLDSHDMLTSWDWSTYTVNVPVDKSEFFVSFNATQDWHSVWGSSMAANSVVTKDAPPPVKLQPALDNVYGNSIELSAGSRNIFNSTLSTEQVIAGLYAVDYQQAPDCMSWTQGEPNARPLLLTTTGTWSDGSCTWKFTAPAGQVFTGGTISFQGAAIWGPTQVWLQAHSVYANNAYGYGGYMYDGYVGRGILYSEDARLTADSWSWTTWTVNVPVNASEFFVTAAAREEYKTVWGSNMAASNVTLTTIPAAGIADAKKKPNSTDKYKVSGTVVASDADYFYIESSDRSAGIRVAKTGYTAVVGINATVVGSLGTLASGERQIVADSVSELPGTILAPLGMNNKALGGANFGTPPAGQQGVTGGIGLNNIGLLVRAWGVVTDPMMGAGIYSINDGSGVEVYVKMLSGSLTEGANVAVTGVVSLTSDGKPTIIVAGAGDVTVLN